MLCNALMAAQRALRSAPLFCSTSQPICVLRLSVPRARRRRPRDARLSWNAAAADAAPGEVRGIRRATEEDLEAVSEVLSSCNAG